MRFKFVMLPPNLMPDWPARVAQAVPEADVSAFDDPDQAMDALADADAMYGTLPQRLFSSAPKLQWLCAPQAGLGGNWFYPELTESNVTVTNTRGIFNDHLSHHILGLIVAWSRRFDHYRRLQDACAWGPGLPIQHLPHCTLLVVGCGEAGAATARLAKQFGMTVLAVDPRRTEPPDGVDELHRPEKLLELLPRADYTAMIVPETPDTLRMMAAPQFAAMKPSGYLINVGRGSTLVLDDLVAALEAGRLAGAALDVFEIEPLPPEHPLWRRPDVFLTPHVSGEGPYCWDRRLELIIDNCRRFATGQPLRNVVDKRNWF